MKSKTCCFAGHSIIYDTSVIDDIASTARKLISLYDVNEFWVGGYGEFDMYAATAIHRLKKEYPHIKLVYVVPYHSKVKPNDKYKYDEIIVADVPEKTPMRYRITKANEFMVDNSSYMICYISADIGGAYRMYKYAKYNSYVNIHNVCFDSPIL